MEIAIAVTALGLSTLSFYFKSALLFLVSVIAWICFAFYMFNQVFANTALSTAFLLLGGAMAIVNAVMALSMLVGGRKMGQINEDAEYESYKKEVMRATRRK